MSRIVHEGSESATVSGGASPLTGRGGRSPSNGGNAFIIREGSLALVGGALWAPIDSLGSAYWWRPVGSVEGRVAVVVALLDLAVRSGVDR